MGEHPSGYVIFTAAGRLSFTLAADGRQPAESNQDKAHLLNTLIAYTGTYRLESDRWITKVDVAWNPEWVGTEQTRFFQITDDILTVHTPMASDAELAGKGLTRSIVCFKRCK